MVCSCGYHFVFNPKRDQFSDGKFTAAVSRAGNNGTYVFTRNQLYTSFLRTREEKIGCLIVLLAIAVIGAIIGLGAGIPKLAIPALFIAVISLLMLLSAKKNPITSRRKFDAFLARWLAQNKIPNLIEQPEMFQSPPNWPEPDIYNYGVDKVLVVQHDLLVDLLVKNNFHGEQACLVVSVNHYPQYIWQRVETILRSQAPTSVFILHDATTPGLRASERFKASHSQLLMNNTVLDLGLFPGDANKMPLLNALKLEKDSMNVPVDVIPYAYLQGLITQSMQEGMPFHTVLIYRDKSNTDGDSGYDSDSGGSYG
jgi:hypothetical protein